ncbi:MAG TPA: threonine synthase [Cyclobacteriaceae bacterium]|nr:threonine synthase [Cyclobacteriaceae bacterium]
MQFYSTSNKNLRVSFEEAVRQGLAPDGGLFMPERIAKLPEQFWKEFREMNFQELAIGVIGHFLETKPSDGLKKIVHHTLQFDAPLKQVDSNLFVLELFHGPTLAFKDFGARFLAAVLGDDAQRHARESVILVATSGDTGSAVANGFLHVSGTRVIVLYPSGKVSEIQEKQFTTLGENITAIEIDGTFDDCQQLVKQAFQDKDLQSLNLTSANSINIARLIPQMLYYFRAFQQLPENDSKPVVISVPSGNFGNLTAGLMARKMGLPIQHCIAATNENDVVPQYLQSGRFKARPSVATISNAMDVGNPSNFSRILELYNHEFESVTHDISGYRISESETRTAMKEVFEKGYLLDPHGAVAWCALRKYLRSDSSTQGIFLATAHPGKFKQTVEETIGKEIELPERLQAFSNKTKQTVTMENDFGKLKKYLLR